jgi:uncharacterized protein (TIGR03546 family)
MKQIVKLIKALNSNQEPWQLSGAVVLGMIVGFLPFFNIFELLFIFLAFILNINIFLFFLSVGLFEILAFVLDPVINKVGYTILTFEPLIAVWTFLYNIPYMRLTDFNNTVVMGSLIFSILFSVPMFFILNKLIIKYRQTIAKIFNKIPILKALKIFEIYDKVAGKD